MIRTALLWCGLILVAASLVTFISTPSPVTGTRKEFIVVLIGSFFVAVLAIGVKNPVWRRSTKFLLVVPISLVSIGWSIGELRFDFSRGATEFVYPYALDSLHNGHPGLRAATILENYVNLSAQSDSAQRSAESLKDILFRHCPGSTGWFARMIKVDRLPDIGGNSYRVAIRMDSNKALNAVLVYGKYDGINNEFYPFEAQVRASNGTVLYWPDEGSRNESLFYGMFKAWEASPARKLALWACLILACFALWQSSHSRVGNSTG